MLQKKSVGRKEFSLKYSKRLSIKEFQWRKIGEKIRKKNKEKELDELMNHFHPQVGLMDK
jgi:hypothetical protein